MYAITTRPGYFSAKTKVFSSHISLAAARRARGKSTSVCIVESDKKKGEIIWVDMFPKVIE